MTPEPELRDPYKELEDIFEEERLAHESLLHLLAWALRQRDLPRPLSDENNWPDEWAMAIPELQEIVFKDTLFFDLARHQVADELAMWAQYEDGPKPSCELLEFSAKLLRSSPHPVVAKRLAWLE